MMNMWNWVKRNKLVVVLVVIVLYLGSRRTTVPVMQGGFESADGGIVAPMMASKVATSFSLPSFGNQPAPSSSKTRLVVTETNLSLVVKQASESVQKIKQIAQNAGGFMVSSYVSSPQEDASGNITIRVPSKSVDQVLAAIKATGLRVTNEQVMGTDVTDQYEDLDARLAVLNETKRKFEEIMAKATQIQDIINVQERIIAVQTQIDSVKGQQQYLTKTAELSKVTVYVSTDEFSLPYAPSEPWRPDVVFKLAVRSLVVHLRSLGSLAIWLGVYSVIWVPGLAVVWWWKRRTRV